MQVQLVVILLLGYFTGLGIEPIEELGYYAKNPEGEDW